MLSHEIKVGQVWQSRDKRDDGKRVTVLAIESDDPYANDFVTIKGFVKTRIRRQNLPRFYFLVKDVSR